MDGMFTTKKDQERFNSYSKEQIYEAYIAERQQREQLNIEVNKLNRLIAEIKFKCESGR